MPKLGKLTLDGSRPVVAVPFAARATASMVRDAVARGLDVAELRLDLYDDASPAAARDAIAAFDDTPTIATVRSAAEGGGWKATEQERLRLLEAVAPHVDGVDIELGASEIRADALRMAHAAGCLTIVSSHDFERTPDLHALTARVEQAASLGAGIVKIATHASSDADVRTLAQLLLAERHRDLIVIAMGPHGEKSRVFFPALGSLLTFARLGRTTAPGQLALDEMVEALGAFYPEYAERRARDSAPAP